MSVTFRLAALLAILVGLASSGNAQDYNFATSNNNTNANFESFASGKSIVDDLKDLKETLAEQTKSIEKQDESIAKNKDAISALKDDIKAKVSPGSSAEKNGQATSCSKDACDQCSSRQTDANEVVFLQSFDNESQPLVPAEGFLYALTS